MLHDSADILRRELPSLSVIKRISFISKETKGHTRRYLKIIEKGINLVFYAKIVIKRVAIEVAELERVSL